jgi:hypothetical protein
MRIKMYENFTGNKISRKVLISEIDDLLVDLTDVGFEWYFPNFFIDNYIDISILKDTDESYPGVSFKVDDTMIDCITTLVDWMREKYGISSVSYRLSMVTGSDIVTKEFGEEEFGLALYEITIILNL